MQPRRFHFLPRSFPRTFEAPHLKAEAVRQPKTNSFKRNVKLLVLALFTLLLIHLTIFVWNEIELPGSTGSILTEPFWNLCSKLSYVVQATSLRSEWNVNVTVEVL